MLGALSEQFLGTLQTLPTRLQFNRASPEQTVTKPPIHA